MAPNSKPQELPTRSKDRKSSKSTSSSKASKASNSSKSKSSKSSKTPKTSDKPDPETSNPAMEIPKKRSEEIPTANMETQVNNESELQPCFGEITVLKDMPRFHEASRMLRKLASFVKPIMRRRGWRVGKLSEMFPDDPRLQGLNLGHTMQILLRLRPHRNSNEFRSYGGLVETMCHELAHIIYSDHGEQFQALHRELMKEADALGSKGYTGEGFLGQGQALGGRRIPKNEARRLARQAAELKRREDGKLDPGHRLGGASRASAPRTRKQLRSAAATAAEKRAVLFQEAEEKRKEAEREKKAQEGCVSEDMSEAEKQKISNAAMAKEYATKNIETQNEEAMVQAYIELLEEEEASKRQAQMGGREDPIDLTDTLPPTSIRTQGSAADSAWFCPRCTFFNASGPPQCDECEGPSPDRVRKSETLQGSSFGPSEDDILSNEAARRSSHGTYGENKAPDILTGSSRPPDSTKKSRSGNASRSRLLGESTKRTSLAGESTGSYYSTRSEDSKGPESSRRNSRPGGSTRRARTEKSAGSSQMVTTKKTIRPGQPTRRGLTEIPEESVLSEASKRSSRSGKSSRTIRPSDSTRGSSSEAPERSFGTETSKKTVRAGSSTKTARPRESTRRSLSKIPEESSRSKASGLSKWFKSSKKSAQPGESK